MCIKNHCLRSMLVSSSKSGDFDSQGYFSLELLFKFSSCTFQKNKKSFAGRVKYSLSKTTTKIINFTTLTNQKQ